MHHCRGTVSHLAARRHHPSAVQRNALSLDVFAAYLAAQGQCLNMDAGTQTFPVLIGWTMHRLNVAVSRMTAIILCPLCKRQYQPQGSFDVFVTRNLLCKSKLLLEDVLSCYWGQTGLRQTSMIVLHMQETPRGRHSQVKVKSRSFHKQSPV